MSVLYIFINDNFMYSFDVLGKCVINGTKYSTCKLVFQDTADFCFKWWWSVQKVDGRIHCTHIVQIAKVPFLEQ